MGLKKIKVFICTYKNDEALYLNIDSLIKSDLMNLDYEIVVLNNYSTIEIRDQYKKYNISVINNEARPDFSCGHLSRSWNQAIINGFKDLKNPDCDIVVAVQNDIIFSTDWCKSLLKYHEKYDFIQVGVGDDFQSFTPNSIIKVGLYDERYCNIGGQHFDYYFRQILFNREKSSINDFYHYTVHNPIYERKINENYFKKDPSKSMKKYIGYSGDNDIIVHQKTGFSRGEISHISSMKYHPLSAAVLRKKWEIVNEKLVNSNIMSFEQISRSFGILFAFNPLDNYDTEDQDDSFWNSVSCNYPQPILYPYFEMDIEEKQSVGYEDCTTYHEIPREKMMGTNRVRTIGKKVVSQDVIDKINKKLGEGSVKYRPEICFSHQESEFLSRKQKLNFHDFKSYENESGIYFFKSFMERSKVKNGVYRCLIVSKTPTLYLAKLLDNFKNFEIWVPESSHRDSDSFFKAMDSFCKENKEKIESLVIKNLEIENDFSNQTNNFNVAFIGPEIFQSIHGRNIRRAFIDKVNRNLSENSLVFGSIGVGDHIRFSKQSYESTMMKNTLSVSCTSDYVSIKEDFLYANMSIISAEVKKSVDCHDFNSWFHFIGNKTKHSIGKKECDEILKDLKNIQEFVII